MFRLGFRGVMMVGLILILGLNFSSLAGGISVAKNSENRILINFMSKINHSTSKPMIVRACYEEKKFHKKAVFVDKPVYKVVTSGADGKVHEVRNVDFVTQEPCKDDGDMKCLDTSPFMQISLNFSKEIQKVQIFKNSELLSEKNVILKCTISDFQPR